MFFALDRADRDAIVQAIKDGFASVGGTSYRTSSRSRDDYSPMTGSRTTLSDSTTEEYETISKQIDDLSRQLQSSISSNLGPISDAIKGLSEGNLDLIKTFDQLGGNIMDTFYKLEGQAQKVYTTFGMGHSSASAINQALADSTEEILKMGGSLEDSYNILSTIGKETGRNFLSAADATKDILAIERVTDVNVNSLVQGFRTAGYSVHQVKDVMEGVVNYTKSVGANVEESSKNVVNNLDKMNLYNFSNGVQGLAKMAAQATMFKMDMRTTFDLTEKLLSPENAIEMAAGLQRLGVATSSLVDPLRLMDLAQNDPEQLQQEVVDLSKEFVKFNEITGKMEIMPGEQRRLREIANTLGMSKDELANMAIQAGELDRKMSMIKFPSLGMTEEDKTLVANMATMKDGKYVVSFKDERGELVTKAIEDLNMTGEKNDLEMIKAFQSGQPKDLLDAAKGQLTTLQDIAANTAAMKGKTFREMAGSEYVQTAAGVQRSMSDMIMKGTEKSIEAASTLLGGSKNFGVSVDKFTDGILKNPEKMVDSIKQALESLKNPEEKFQETLNKVITGDLTNIQTILKDWSVDMLTKFEKLIEEQSKVTGQAPKLYEVYKEAIEKITNVKTEIKASVSGGPKKVEDFMFNIDLNVNDIVNPLPKDSFVINDGKLVGGGTNPLDENKENLTPLYTSIFETNKSIIGYLDRQTSDKGKSGEMSIMGNVKLTPFKDKLFPNANEEFENLSKEFKKSFKVEPIETPIKDTTKLKFDKDEESAKTILDYIDKNFKSIPSTISFSSNWNEILENFEKLKKQFINYDVKLSEDSVKELNESNKSLTQTETKKIVYEPETTKVEESSEKITKTPIEQKVDAKVTNVDAKKLDEATAKPTEIQTKFVFPENQEQWGTWIKQFNTDLENVTSDEANKLESINKIFGELNKSISTIKSPNIELSEEQRKKYIDQVTELGKNITLTTDIKNLDVLKDKLTEINKKSTSEFVLNLNQGSFENVSKTLKDLEKPVETNLKVNSNTEDAKKAVDELKSKSNIESTIIINKPDERKFENLFENKKVTIDYDLKLPKTNIQFPINNDEIEKTIKNLRDRSVFNVPLNFSIDSKLYEEKKKSIESESINQITKFIPNTELTDKTNTSFEKPLERKLNYEPNILKLNADFLKKETESLTEKPILFKTEFDTKGFEKPKSLISTLQEDVNKGLILNLSLNHTNFDTGYKELKEKTDKIPTEKIVEAKLNSKSFNEETDLLIKKPLTINTSFDKKIFEDTELSMKKLKESSEKINFEQPKTNLKFTINQDEIDSTIKNIKNKSVFDVPLTFSIDSKLYDEKKKGIQSESISQNTTFTPNTELVDKTNRLFEKPLERKLNYEPNISKLNTDLIKKETGSLTEKPILFKTEFDTKEFERPKSLISKLQEDAKGITVNFGLNTTKFDTNYEGLKEKIDQTTTEKNIIANLKLDSKLFDDETKKIDNKSIFINTEINKKGFEESNSLISKMEEKSNKGVKFNLDFDSEKFNLGYDEFMKKTNQIPNNKVINTNIKFENEPFDNEIKKISEKSIIIKPKIEDKDFKLSQESLISKLEDDSKKGIKFNLDLNSEKFNTGYDEFMKKTNQIPSIKTVNTELTVNTKNAEDSLLLFENRKTKKIPLEYDTTNLNLPKIEKQNVKVDLTDTEKQIKDLTTQPISFNFKNESLIDKIKKESENTTLNLKTSFESPKLPESLDLTYKPLTTVIPQNNVPTYQPTKDQGIVTTINQVKPQESQIITENKPVVEPVKNFVGPQEINLPRTEETKKGNMEHKHEFGSLVIKVEGSNINQRTAEEIVSALRVNPTLASNLEESLRRTRDGNQITSNQGYGLIA